MRIPFDLPPASSRSFDAVGFGLNSIDLLTLVAEHPRPNTKQRLRRFARLPGGQAATAMVTCSRLGWRTRYIGRFGDDDGGRLGRESLMQDGVDISESVTVPGATNQFAIIIVDERSGDRTIMFDRHPGLSIGPADIPEEAVQSGRVLLVDCHETLAAAQAARFAHRAGLPTLVDVERVRPGIGELLKEIDIVIAAEEFPVELTGYSELGRALPAIAKEFGAPVVCVTLGRDGSLAWADGREIRTPAFAVQTVDTTGAGDVFRGGFIAGWLAGGKDASLEEVLTYANAVAALSCRMLGAREGIPSRNEVELLLATH